MRGKHGAKAANRLAQLDNDLVDELRARVSSLTGERDEARKALDLAQRKTSAEIAREAAALADARLRELRIQLAEEQRSRVQERDTIARDVGRLLDELHVRMPMDGYVRLAAILGVRVGDVVAAGGSGNRHARRTTVREARALADTKRQLGIE